MKSPDSLASPQYPIRVVVRRTGLNASVLRAWERRYGAVEPGRSDGGQRLYSEEDIRKLVLLRELTEVGHNISQVAPLDSDELRGLLRQDLGAAGFEGLIGGGRIDAPGLDRLGSEKGGSDSGPSNGRNGDSGKLAAAAGLLREREGGTSGLLQSALDSVHAMDVRELELTLNRAAMALSTEELVDELVLPLLTSIGHLWVKGEVGPAAEHMASGVVRRFLYWLLGTLGVRGAAPVMVVGTPAGHHHEFGALIAAVVGAAEGWTVVSLGPDLPASEIAEAARRKGAALVALSALHPPEDPSLATEVRRLRGALPPSTDLLLGGPAAQTHAEELTAPGVRVLGSLSELRGLLRQGLRAMRN